MKYLLSTLIILSFIGCGHNKEELQFLTKEKVMLDSITKIREVVHNVEKGDSISYSYTAIAYIEVPQSSKRVKFYSIDFVNGGDAYLSIITDDNKSYPSLEVKNPSVASVLNILEHDYVRIDTINIKKLRFYVYKADPEQVHLKPLKAF